MSFEKSLAWVLQEEGGYVNHPQDPGGATNKGVTQAVYDGWRREHKRAVRSVKLIESDEMASIYRHDYWDRINGDRLPAGVDYAVFDLAVNSGANRAARFLQGAVGAVVDGQIGPKTIARITDPVLTILELGSRREIFLRSLGTFDTFGRGWIARINRVQTRALAEAKR